VVLAADCEPVGTSLTGGREEGTAAATPQLRRCTAVLQISTTSAATAGQSCLPPPPAAGGARLPPILDALHGGAGSRSERGSHDIWGRRRMRRSIESATSRPLMSKQIFRRPRPNAWPDAAGMIHGNSTCGCRGDWRAYRHAWIRTQQFAVGAGAVAAGASADRLVRVTVKKEEGER
jgi:hypothetical protein